MPEILKRKQVQLIAKSLISFEPSFFEINEDYEVIFFSSIRSAQFFLEKKDLKEGVKVACFGTETSIKLQKMGINPSFIGENSSNPIEVANKFKSWLQNRKVIFPHSDHSFHSISKLLNQSQVINVQVYQTNYIQKIIPPCDLYIFSSPSNLESFKLKNILKINSNVIAWGKSTEDQLLKYKIPLMKVLQTGTLNELETYISNLISI